MTVVEGFAAKAHDARLDGFGGREDKLGSPEGGFHHEGIGLWDFDGLGGEPRSGLEIAGIEEGFAGWGFDAHHRGTEDMTGGIKLNVEGTVLVGFAVIERNAAPRHRVTEADADKVDGGRGRKKGLVAGGVVAVGMGHDRKGLGAPRVHPKPAIGQIEPAAFNRSQHSRQDAAVLENRERGGRFLGGLNMDGFAKDGGCRFHHTIVTDRVLFFFTTNCFLHCRSTLNFPDTFIPGIRLNPGGISLSSCSVIFALAR